MPKGIYQRQPRAPKHDAPALVAAICGLYEKGLTQAEVGRHLNLSQKAVFNIMRRNGVAARVAAKRDQTGEKNASWKGDAAGYHAFHKRLYALHGKPSRCTVCGTEQAPVFDYANLTGNYADPSDFAAMCRSCHARYDGKIANLRKAVTHV